MVPNDSFSWKSFISWVFFPSNLALAPIKEPQGSVGKLLGNQENHEGTAQQGNRTTSVLHLITCFHGNSKKPEAKFLKARRTIKAQPNREINERNHMFNLTHFHIGIHWTLLYQKMPLIDIQQKQMKKVWFNTRWENNVCSICFAKSTLQEEKCWHKMWYKCVFKLWLCREQTWFQKQKCWPHLKLKVKVLTTRNLLIAALLYSSSQPQCQT